jgi:hypothetical protein
MEINHTNRTIYAALHILGQYVILKGLVTLLQSDRISAHIQSNHHIKNLCTSLI